MASTDHAGWALPSEVCHLARMAALLKRHVHVVVSGAVENQVDFYDRFVYAVLPGRALRCPPTRSRSCSACSVATSRGPVLPAGGCSASCERCSWRSAC